MKIDLIIKNAGELLTLSGSPTPRSGREMNELNIIKDGAVAVHDGKITAVGKTKDILNTYTSDNVIDADNKVVMPGFVDPHTHPVFVHTRENEFEMRVMGKSYVEISQSGGGIRSSIKAVVDADEDYLLELAVKRVKRMIEYGTTSIEAKSGYGLTTESELKMLKVINSMKQALPIDIKSTFLGAHEYPAEYKNNHEAYIDILIRKMIPAVVEQGLADYCDIFTEDHVFSIEESRRILNAAKEAGLKIKMHADEIEPIGGAELAAEMGAVSADHLGAASDEGIKQMSKAGVVAVLLPGTLFSLGSSKYARARKMIDEGLPVALATDYNPGSCNCDSMQFVITLATLQMKMSVAEAITASTINAAHAIEMGNEIGSLEEGKYADILIMDMPSYKFLPYHFGSNNVDTVFKKGKVLYKRNQLEF